MHTEAAIKKQRTDLAVINEIHKILTERWWGGGRWGGVLTRTPYILKGVTVTTTTHHCHNLAIKPHRPTNAHRPTHREALGLWPRERSVWALDRKSFKSDTAKLSTLEQKGAGRTRAPPQRGERAQSASPSDSLRNPWCAGTALNLHVTMSKKFSELSKLIKRNLLCKSVK